MDIYINGTTQSSIAIGLGKGNGQSMRRTSLTKIFQRSSQRVLIEDHNHNPCKDLNCILQRYFKILRRCFEDLVRFSTILYGLSPGMPCVSMDYPCLFGQMLISLSLYRQT